MTRYIDADKIPWSVDDWAVGKTVSKELVDRMPTVEVVPVQSGVKIDINSVPKGNLDIAVEHAKSMIRDEIANKICQYMEFAYLPNLNTMTFDCAGRVFVYSENHEKESDHE